jgi:hypothetical protein
MANKPNNPSLWSKAKSLAKQKFDVYPSAYANGWAAKWYKGKGGTWRKAQFGMEISNKDISIPPLPFYYETGGEDVSEYSPNLPQMQAGGEPDGGMALQQMNAVIDKLSKLRKFITPDSDLEPWISSKLAVMDHYADAVSDYMTYSENPEMRIGGSLPRYQKAGRLNESVGADAQKIGKCGLEGSSAGSGCDPLVDRPATKQELYPTRYATLYSQLPSDRKERKAFIQNFDQLRGTNPALAGYSPEDYAAAAYEANIYNNYFGGDRQGKYYNPETGALIPEMESSVRPNSAAAYYRTKFPKADRITPEQIIGLMPLEQRKALIAAGYKQKKGGSLPRMQSAGQCPEGFVFLEEVGDCVPLDMFGTDVAPTRGISRSGIELSYPKFSIGYNYATDPFGRKTHDMKFSLPEAFRKRGSLNLSGTYTPRQSWAANLDSDFRFAKRDAERAPRLTLNASVDKFFGDPELSEMSRMERLLPPQKTLNYNIEAGLNIPLRKQGNLKISGSYGKQAMKYGGWLDEYKN